MCCYFKDLCVARCTHLCVVCDCVRLCYQSRGTSWPLDTGQFLSTIYFAQAMLNHEMCRWLRFGMGVMHMTIQLMGYFNKVPSGKSELVCMYTHYAQINRKLLYLYWSNSEMCIIHTISSSIPYRNRSEEMNIWVGQLQRCLCEEVALKYVPLMCQ